MMELGATVCTPKAPACGTCPLREGCAGAALELAGGGVQGDGPLPEKGEETREAGGTRRGEGGRAARPGGCSSLPSRRSCSCVALRWAAGRAVGFPSAIEDVGAERLVRFYSKCAAVVGACAAGGTAGGSSGTVRVSRVEFRGGDARSRTFGFTCNAQHEVWEMSDDDSAPSTRGDTAGGRGGDGSPPRSSRRSV